MNATDEVFEAESDPNRATIPAPGTSDSAVVEADAGPDRKPSPGHLPQDIPQAEGARSLANQAQMASLEQRVRNLETAADHDRQTLAVLRAECESLRRALSGWAWQQVTDEDVRRWAEESDEDSLPLSQFIGELEQIARGK